ncbi:MAG TPA: regulatory iron-sulfur-containing complex subunit RicT, partial [Anaerolinea sp.]|nr:regulatory iron-sulfur-containing complex subunit RicT [Anaerolinea sp.]
SQVPDVQLGDSVVVETSRGWQIGTVAQMLPTPETGVSGLKEIDRKATPRDLLLHQSYQSKQNEVIAAAKQRARELNLAGVKIVAAEYSYDGARLSIIYNSETDEKVELKSLRQDMGRAFAPTQVEMRQIGPRDVAKLLGGMGACGLEQRCCSQFLCEFNSISIRMAKEQGISLTPSEITGMCGRLRCCLVYEYQQYVDSRAKLPRRNKRVMTPDGEGRVLDQVPLREAVVVEYPDGIRKEVPGSAVIVVEEGAPLPPRPVIVTDEPAEEMFSAPPPVSEPRPRPENRPERRDRGPRTEQRSQPPRNRGQDRPQGGEQPPRNENNPNRQRPQQRRRGGKKPNNP